MKFANGLGWFLFLTIRGIALWALIPIATLAWLLLHSWAQKASIGHAICWYDRNFNLALVRGPLRPLIGLGKSGSFVPLFKMRTMPTYRIRWVAEMV